MQRLAFVAITLTLGAVVSAGASAQAAPARTYNTVIEKLARGEPVIGGTIDTPDPDTCCAVANAGFDFTWIEMQHSALTYSEVEDMIWACRGAPAIPFIRVPDATEGDIQKATDIGALGIIIPMVDDVQKVRNAVTFAHYPPLGKRSQGGGRYGALWGNDYRATANDNVMIVAMIESPAGVAIAREIANEPGVDAVFAASSDLSSFSARRQGDPEYEALVNVIKDETLGAGRVLGGPLAWLSSRPEDGYLFFQGPARGRSFGRERGRRSRMPIRAAICRRGRRPCRARIPARSDQAAFSDAFFATSAPRAPRRARRLRHAHSGSEARDVSPGATS